ncbi:hypothetical protein JMJ56_28410 [Belnapia sp. T18]|uniref:Uncharacterized protein n=1 Tax=Belnapia arida TaxID=2804533 RepID=A0ABS1UB48_9PROT|nr:hypothetical protein [Belnapia arida]MBL6081912.1 hypothetical protein [Belnapia arida]
MERLEQHQERNRKRAVAGDGRSSTLQTTKAGLISRGAVGGIDGFVQILADASARQPSADRRCLLVGQDPPDQRFDLFPRKTRLWGHRHLTPVSASARQNLVGQGCDGGAVVGILIALECLEQGSPPGFSVLICLEPIDWVQDFPYWLKTRLSGDCQNGL